MAEDTQPQWLNPKEAAAYLNTSPWTLSDWRYKGRGPKYSKMGPRLVRYAKADLDAFMETRA